MEMTQRMVNPKPLPGKRSQKKVNASSFSPGDIIAFNKEMYGEEVLTVPSSGMRVPI